jgi:hypothetical protein
MCDSLIANPRFRDDLPKVPPTTHARSPPTLPPRPPSASSAATKHLAPAHTRAPPRSTPPSTHTSTAAKHAFQHRRAPPPSTPPSTAVEHAKHAREHHRRARLAECCPSGPPRTSAQHARQAATAPARTHAWPREVNRPAHPLLDLMPTPSPSS